MILQKESSERIVDRMHKINDNEIIQRCKNGDMESFGEIVQKYQRVIYTIVLRMLRDPADAEDITQTAFIKAYEKLDSYKTNHSFYSWIYRIAVNEALNFIKKSERLVELHDTHNSIEDDPETEYSKNELQTRIDNALENLKPEHRVIIVLRHFGELTYRDISEILDIPEKTVKSRLFSARQELRTILT